MGDTGVSSSVSFCTFAAAHAAVAPASVAVAAHPLWRVGIFAPCARHHFEDRGVGFPISFRRRTRLSAVAASPALVVVA